MDMTEIWMPVIGFESAYEVSNIGRVKSLARTRAGRGGVPTSVRERVLRLSDTNGYVGVNLGKGKFSSVHRLVAGAFLSNKNGLPEVNHIDGDKSNNRVENLEWVTHKENALHASKNGLLATGERHGKRKNQGDQNASY